MASTRTRSITLRFIGYFPADNPELLIAISADEPLRRTGYYGGVVCAPVFKRIAETSGQFSQYQTRRAT
jgi:cell division protein FtsI (penicillin-binding protein 3)